MYGCLKETLFKFNFAILCSLIKVNYERIISSNIFVMHCLQEIAGEELVKVLQIKNKIPRRKALSSLEEKVLTILSEKGYVSKDETVGIVETIPDLLEDEDEDEEVVVDGEVDEGDVHIKPKSRKSTPMVNFNYTFRSSLSG